MFAICVFMFKWPPAIISCQRFSHESRREQAKKVFDSVRDLMRTNRSPLFEIARVLVCFDHTASRIVNADHGITRGAAKLPVSGCVAGCVWLTVPKATK
jgi:hypothetical protein